MQIWSYLIPENNISVGIIIIQICLFLFWCGLLLYFLVRCDKYIKEVKACENVQPLNEYLLNYFTGSSQDAEDSPEISVEEKFEKYADDKIDPDSPVRKHLWAIFQAGFYNTQFDSSALIKGTVGEAFKINNTLRSILSVFIILGLLGTLFGLSSSLSGVAPLSSDSLQDTAAIREIIKNLLNELKSAFAPSVWGVGFTILGVLVFAFYYYRCNTFNSTLERSTLTNWVTQLIRPPARTLMETITKGEEQIRKNLEVTRENIKNSARFKQTIDAVDSQTGAFKENLRNANQTVLTFNESAGRLSRFSENFISAADKFAQYNEKIEQLFQDIQRKSADFQKQILDSFNNSQNFQITVVESLKYQHQEINDVIQLLKQKDAGDSQFRQKTETQFQSVVERLDTVAGEAGKTFKLLGGRNQEIAVALSNQIGEPLKTEVSARLTSVSTELNSVSQRVGEGLNVVGEKLGGVSKELEARLTAVQNSVQSSMKDLSAPFKEAAEQLSGTYANFSKDARHLVTNLRNDFIDQNRQNEEKLNSIQKLNPQIAQLLGKLSDLTESQASQNNVLAQNLGVLTDSVSMLSGQVLQLATALQNMPRQSAVPKPVIKQPPIIQPPIIQSPSDVPPTPLPRFVKENGGTNEAPPKSAPQFEPRPKNDYEGSTRQQEDGILARLKRLATFWRRR